MQNVHAAVHTDELKISDLAQADGGLIIRWSDGHSTGIYTFERLRELCPCCRKG